MELHEAAAALADGHFSLIHDAANRNLIFARSDDDAVHAIVAEAVDEPTGHWLVECLRHGAAGAAEALAADPGDDDEPAPTVKAAAVTGQRRERSRKSAAKPRG